MSSVSPGRRGRRSRRSSTLKARSRPTAASKCIREEFPMPSVLETLKERGFMQQCTAEPGLDTRFPSQPVAFYCGFDPTADSLHCGSLMPIMAMAHLQKAGHTPIAIIGGGTAMVGDPSGKTELRKLLSADDIAKNGAGILAQLQR